MAQPRNARRATNIERFNNLIYNLAKKTLMRVKTTPMVEVTLTARSKLGEKKNGTKHWFMAWRKHSTTVDQ
jgi:hypothetical protein